jgi:hypothetical protein
MQINLVERSDRSDQILENAQSDQDLHQHLYEDRTPGVCVSVRNGNGTRLRLIYNPERMTYPDTSRPLRDPTPGLHDRDGTDLDALIAEMRAGVHIHQAPAVLFEFKAWIKELVKQQSGWVLIYFVNHGKVSDLSFPDGTLTAAELRKLLEDLTAAGKLVLFVICACESGAVAGPVQNGTLPGIWLFTATTGAEICVTSKYCEVGPNVWQIYDVMFARAWEFVLSQDLPRPLTGAVLVSAMNSCGLGGFRAAFSLQTAASKRISNSCCSDRTPSHRGAGETTTSRTARISIDPGEQGWAGAGTCSGSAFPCHEVPGGGTGECCRVYEGRRYERICSFFSRMVRVNVPAEERARSHGAALQAERLRFNTWI